MKEVVVGPESDLRQLAVLWFIYSLWEFLLKRVFWRPAEIFPAPVVVVQGIVLAGMLVLGTLGFSSWALVCGCIVVVGLRVLGEGILLPRLRIGSLERYLVLQALTGGLLVFMWWSVGELSVHGWYAECEGAILGSLGRAGEGLQDHTVPVLLVLSAYLFMVDGGAKCVRGVLDKFPVLMEHVAALARGDGESRGEWIGILERVIALTFVLTGNYTAVAFVLTAKSIARFKELDNKEFAEYYLLGTSASVAIALLAGSLVRLMF